MDRKFEKVIVDEVDNMLLDKANHITMLSTPFPGFHHLSHALKLIWFSLCEYNKHFKQTKDGKLIYIEKLEETPNGDIMIDSSDKDNQQIPISDKLEFIVDRLYLNFKEKMFNFSSDDVKSNHNQNKHKKPYEDKDLREDEKMGDNEMQNKDGKPDQSEKLNEEIDNYKQKFPKYLNEFVLSQLKNWITSAYFAFYEYNKDNQYIVVNENGRKRIKIVDIANTGVIYNNMSLSDGLQQFLEIKEQLEVSIETIVSCFISNVTFLKKYENHLYGLTGTIGSCHEIETLKEIYKIDISYIPTYKVSRLTEYPMIVKSNYFDWIGSISQNATSCFKEGRVVLIINDVISNIDKIKQKIIADSNPLIKDNDILAYYNNHIIDEVSNQDLSEPKIIIATYLAGRGTDIKISEKISDRGGLHVILTILPQNKRVERQAFGRAARIGHKGSCQLIANKEDL